MNTKELEKLAQLKGYDPVSVFVDALNEAGVEDWEGYDEAISIYKKYLKDIAESED